MQKSERIVRYTEQELDEMLRRGEDRTNLARLDALTEEELEASIDIEEEGEIDWAAIQVSHPLLKRQLTVHSGGPSYQTRINAVLRSYVEAQRKAS